MPTSWPFLDWPHPIAFAHRGGASEAPENTLPAFQYAIDLGYRYLETDVHATADGVLVAFHDEALDRVTDRTGLIRELPWSEVAKARIGGEPIPLLEDVVGAWPEARVNIDAKHDTSVVPLAGVLARTGAHDRVCVAAFSDRRLARIRALTGGRVCTSMGPGGIARLRTLSLIGAPPRWMLRGWPRAACAQLPVRHGRIRLVDHRFVRAAHRLGLVVHVWTIDDRVEMEALLDLGVDGLMTDRPTVLKEVLVERGQWV